MDCHCVDLMGMLIGTETFAAQKIPNCQKRELENIQNHSHQYIVFTPYSDQSSHFGIAVIVFPSDNLHLKAYFYISFFKIHKNDVNKFSKTLWKENYPRLNIKFIEGIIEVISL